MSEGKTAIRFKKHQSRLSEDEWLGPESHVPNMSRELRRREPRQTGFPAGWVGGVMFLAGVAAGCFAMRLIYRRSRIS